jgi:hypothetical protein
MARGHCSYDGRGWTGFCGAMEYMAWCVIVRRMHGLGQRSRSPVARAGAARTLWNRRRNMAIDTEAALRKRPNLGFRDTVELIQYRQKLEKIGITEYDVTVARCRNAFFRRYQQFLRRRPQ